MMEDPCQNVVGWVCFVQHAFSNYGHPLVHHDTNTIQQEIAEIKLPDLNTDNVDSAVRSILGTAKNMGITVTE